VLDIRKGEINMNDTMKGTREAVKWFEEEAIKLGIDTKKTRQKRKLFFVSKSKEEQFLKSLKK